MTIHFASSDIVLPQFIRLDPSLDSAVVGKEIDDSRIVTTAPQLGGTNASATSNTTAAANPRTDAKGEGFDASRLALQIVLPGYKLFSDPASGGLAALILRGGASLAAKAVGVALLFTTSAEDMPAGGTALLYWGALNCGIALASLGRR